ncbi:serine hydrolase domain-containing protein [Arsukibacterium perlucidum]|uniref:serine hydrolase domain-containing protein n=1 Tax=Arsukibacterium perlucidum TaxID=368811 RepID=UPI00036CC188|nr:serine hydrolase domain-containing protein [Arsukibacterium perlucidum]
MKTTGVKLKFRIVFAGVLTLLVASQLSAAEPLQHWQQKIEQSAFSGTVFVATSDAIIFHQSFGLADRENQRAFDEHTVFDIGSVTKQFTATAIMLLVEQGKLSLSATIDNYFSDVPSDKKSITIHHLLTHSSGLPPNPPGLGLYDVIDTDVYRLQIFKQELLALPGESYNYSNIGYGLLAQLIEIATGQNWEDYIKQHILLPAGLTETGYRLLSVPQDRLAINYGADPNWLQRMLRLQARSRSVGDSLQHLREKPGARWLEGSGGFSSTAQDMHAWFLRMHARQILSEQSWSQMFDLHIAENADQTLYYGYGWVIDNQSGMQRINHSGSNGYSYATFDYYPEIGLFVLTASNDIDNYPYPLMKEMKKSMQQMAANKSIQPNTNVSAD